MLTLLNVTVYDVTKNWVLETCVFFCSYANETTEKEEVIKKLVTGDNAPVNKVYKPEFVTLAPPLLNCQDEVSTYCICHVLK